MKTRNICFSRFTGGFFGGLLCLLLIVLGCSPSIVIAEKSVTVTYYHTDVLGSVIATSDEFGSLEWQRGYQPYGEIQLPRDSSDTDTRTNSLGYTGKPRDPSGLVYLGARYYDPLAGRFMAVDPAGVDASNPYSFNRYAYANNNPYKYVDPTGESPLDIFFLAVDVVKLGVAIYTGTGVADAVKDVAWSIVGVASPAPFVGQAGKAARVAAAVSKAEKAKEIATVAKNIPNPGGRLGKLSTRQHIDDIATEMEKRGFTITGGGNRLPEEYLPGPGGGRKGASFPDITATKNDRTVRVNTVDTRADGITPTTREAANAARIRSQTPGDHLLLIPKP